MTQKALTLSIIIPAYNEENHLRACLEAVAIQNVAPNEVIVVDNNSTDKTAIIAKAFPFVKLVKEKKQGLYFARQRGMDAASGDILGRIDADTIIDPNWTAAVLTAFIDDTTQAISGPVGYHDMPCPNFTQRLEDLFLRLARLGHYNFLLGANMALRRSAWLLVRDELCNKPYIFEDVDIAIHLKQLGILSTYAPIMKATMSARRFEDSPVDFIRYIGGNTRTLEYHDLTAPAGAHLAELAFSLAYFMTKPLHMVFDPELRRPSLSYLMKRREARPDPMMVS